jgi:hypothetical protein
MLCLVELWKHEAQILDEHDLPIVGEKRRPLAALAVERLEQRREQIVEVGAGRTDEGRRQLDIVSKRRRYLRLVGRPIWLNARELVRVAGHDPAASGFRHRHSSSELHPDGAR